MCPIPCRTRPGEVMESSLPRLAALLAFAPMSLSLSAADSSATTKSPREFLACFGTARGGACTGFAIATFNADTGRLTVPAVTATAHAPSIFIVSPDGRRLYTCFPGRTFEEQPGGGIGAFAVDPATGS